MAAILSYHRVSCSTNTMAEETTARSLSNCKKRRGITRASITRFNTKLKDLESKADQAGTFDLAQQMKLKLESLDKDFKTYHYALVDLVDDEATLASEQETLDNHDDEMAILAVRVQQLITLSASPSSDTDPRKIASRRLARLQKSISSVKDAVTALKGDSDDAFVLRQYEEQLTDHKKELSDIRTSLLSIDLEDGDELNTSQASLDKALFDCSLLIKKSLKPLAHETTPIDSKGVKLPKLDVPTFDGNILHWRSFWEQFCVAVHRHTNLSNSEKLVYLQHALKGGSAKQVIEGLSRSGDYYAEAIESLQLRFDRPRLIHQTHVRMILETPSLKEGTGRELRRLHDTVQQHLRALKAMDYEPSGPFITSVLELKLDTNTMFEWQKHSQSATSVPHYGELLEFINLRAQASETSVTDQSKKSSRNDAPSAKRLSSVGKPIASFTASTSELTNNCVLCKVGKHPLHTCSKFKGLTHDKMIATLKTNDLCMNCLRPGHFVKQCRSLNRCRKCQKPHHTLLHIDPKAESPVAPTTTVPGSPNPAHTTTNPSIPSHAASGLASNSLLMTCCVLVNAPDGSTAEARALLDCASSASFVSERLAQSLNLPRTSQSAVISGVAGLSHKSTLQPIARFSFSSRTSPSEIFHVTAIVVPRVTCDLPLHSISFDSKWKHLSNIQLADPNFGHPGRIDMLLGVDVFVEVMLHGRRTGPHGSPIAFETRLGWVLAGNTKSCAPSTRIATHHTSILTGDDILRKFWEIEEKPVETVSLSAEERSVVNHFKVHHFREDGRFVVPLPRKPDAQPLGESRSQAVRRYLSLERSLTAKDQFADVDDVMKEYFDMGHAERVPAADLSKPHHDTFYLPMHIVRKESSSTTKLRAVFDASAKSSTGVSLNDTLQVGPTVHSALIDVLLRFRSHRVALTSYISRMYRAVKLVPSDRDFHRFVWRSSPGEQLSDYRMTRVTFGVSASSFAANMSVKQNAIDFGVEYPLAAKAVNDSFYVDDCISGADTVDEAITLQQQLQELFSKAGFLLRKWRSSELTVLERIPPDLRDSQSMQQIPNTGEYTKTLGIEWNSSKDHFRLTIAKLPPIEHVSKRFLVSDVAKTFDILGWFSPTMIKVKILLQQLWELKVSWDDTVPPHIHADWLQWRAELDLLSRKLIPRYYFSKSVDVASIQLHGFCDASEQAYAGVIYLRMTGSDGSVEVSLVCSKTKVAPIKRLTIPRLELCGAHLLSQLLHHVQGVLHIPSTNVFAWTDSTIVLNWIVGNPRRFKTYVGNRVSSIVENIPPERWNHVNGTDNPADCASRGLFPSELLEHHLWWSGPEWLRSMPTCWPEQLNIPPNEISEEKNEICLHTTIAPRTSIIQIERFSSFDRLIRVTAWSMRFLHNCRMRKQN